MYVLILITLLYGYVREVGTRTQYWPLHEEVVLYMVTIPVIMVLARVMQAIYAAFNDQYYEDTMRRRAAKRYLRTHGKYSL